MIRYRRSLDSKPCGLGIGERRETQMRPLKPGTDDRETVKLSHSGGITDRKAET